MDGLECEEESSLPEEDESNENIINSKLTSAKRCVPPTKRKKKQTFCQSWLTVPEIVTNFRINLLASWWKEIGRKFRNFGKEI